jgi:hypothetical protein
MLFRAILFQFDPCMTREKKPGASAFRKKMRVQDFVNFGDIGPVLKTMTMDDTGTQIASITPGQSLEETVLPVRQA